MKKLSPKVIAEIKQMLPQLRSEVCNEFCHWKEFTTGEGFFSDEKVIGMIPLAAYQQLLITRGIHTDNRFIIEILNDGFMDLRMVALQALRNIMLVDYHSKENRDKVPA